MKSASTCLSEAARRSDGTEVRGPAAVKRVERGHGWDGVYPDSRPFRLASAFSVSEPGRLSRERLHGVHVLRGELAGCEANIYPLKPARPPVVSAEAEGCAYVALAAVWD